MNLPIITASGRKFAAVWMLILIQNVIYTGAIEITGITCDEKYDMDYYKNVEVTHSGTDILYKNPCSVEFVKSSYDQYLCISKSSIQLDCDTALEYHEGFVKNYIDPEVEMSCRDIRYEEWCPSQYQDNVYIVIRKSSKRTSDNIRLRVYLKDVPEKDSASGSIASTVILSVLIPIAFVVMCSCLCVVLRRQSQKANAARTQVAYQTTSGAVNVPAGQGYTSSGQGYTSPYPASNFSQPNPYAHLPVQQGGLQGNYNVYPMQTAYPVEQGVTAGNPGQNYSSAPPMDMNAPPPSYESLISEKH